MSVAAGRRVTPWQLGVAAAVAAGLLFLAVLTIRGEDRIYTGDPRSYRLVAEDPFGTGERLVPFGEGVAYRYGRIAFPLLAWALAGGRAGLVEWTLPLVAVVAFGVCVALAARLCADAGKPAERGLLVAGVPTLVSSTILVYGEPVAIALLLGTFAAYLRGRLRVALLLAAALALAREALLLALLPIVVREARRRPARLAVMGLALVPYAAWMAWVRARVGEWPFLDDSASRREAVALPFSGIGRALDSFDGDTARATASVLLAVVAAATFVVAVLMLRRASGDRLVAWAAVVLAALGLFLGFPAYRLPQEGFRVLVPAHVFLALLAARQARVRSSP